MVENQHHWSSSCWFRLYYVWLFFTCYRIFSVTNSQPCGSPFLTICSVIYINANIFIWVCILNVEWNWILWGTYLKNTQKFQSEAIFMFYAVTNPSITACLTCFLFIFIEHLELTLQLNSVLFQYIAHIENLTKKHSCQDFQIFWVRSYFPWFPILVHALFLAASLFFCSFFF